MPRCAKNFTHPKPSLEGRILIGSLKCFNACNGNGEEWMKRLISKCADWPINISILRNGEQEYQEALASSNNSGSWIYVLLQGNIIKEVAGKRGKKKWSPKYAISSPLGGRVIFIYTWLWMMGRPIKTGLPKNVEYILKKATEPPWEILRKNSQRGKKNFTRDINRFIGKPTVEDEEKRAIKYVGSQ